jgi:hypothetical protein
MPAYSTAPTNNVYRVEEPRAEYTLSAPADFEIPESQRRELRARLAHHLAHPYERTYSPEEVEAYCLSRHRA